MKSKSFHLYITLLVFFSYGLNFVSSKLKCTHKVPAAALDPPSLMKLVRFFETQVDVANLFGEFVNTGLEMAEQACTEPPDNLENYYLPMEKLVRAHGFDIEKHSVTTEDGYILGIFRIPCDGPPVLLVHGTCGSSEDFVSPGPTDGMAYQLSTAGYDVWFLNVRGCKFSTKHKELSSKCAEFWDFSFHEIGKYDYPATIDFILNQTGADSLSLIGWSQGSSSFFTMGSLCPEYNDKVNLFVALSPVAYMNHCISPIVRLLALDEDLTYVFLSAIGVNDLAPSNVLTKAIGRTLCSPNPVSQIVCGSFLSLMTGFDGSNSNITNLPGEIARVPSGCSIKHITHYAQLVNSEHFCPFDYGKKKNIEIYGSTRPPPYPLAKVTAPVALFYGNRDWIANVTDVNRLKCQLPNVVDDYCIDKYNHLDYAWSRNVNTDVTDRIINLLADYVPSPADSCQSCDTDYES